MAAPIEEPRRQYEHRQAGGLVRFEEELLALRRDRVVGLRKEERVFEASIVPPPCPTQPT